MCSVCIYCLVLSCIVWYGMYVCIPRAHNFSNGVGWSSYKPVSRVLISALWERERELADRT